MGVFDEDDNSDEFEAEFEKQKDHSPGQYIAYHARKQLAFDMWWLVLALWLSKSCSSRAQTNCLLMLDPLRSLHH